MLFLDITDRSKSFNNSWLCLGEILLDYSLSLPDVLILLHQSRLDLDRRRLLSLRLLLIRHHLSELLIGFGVLCLELSAFGCKTMSQLLDLTDSISQLIKTDVEVTLLILKLFSLFVKEADIVIDAVSLASLLYSKESTYKSR
jgi:hypothetical protein